MILYLDNYKVDFNFNILFTKFQDFNKTILDILLDYNYKSIITSKLILQNILNIVEPKILPKNNNYFLQSKVINSNKTINSKIFFKN